MTTLERLKAVCTREPNRPTLKDPWQIEHAGGPWTVATDGTRIVAVAGHVEGAVLDKPTDCRPDVHAFITAPDGGIEVSRALLLEWCGDATDYVTCPDCNGKPLGEVECHECLGEGHVECSCDCGACSHTIDCDDCDATGRLDAECDCFNGVVRAEPQQGRLFDLMVNKGLLAGVLATAPERFMVAATGDMIRMWSPEWRGVLMRVVGKAEGVCPVTEGAAEAMRGKGA